MEAKHVCNSPFRGRVGIDIGVALREDDQRLTRLQEGYRLARGSTQTPRSISRRVSCRDLGADDRWPAQQTGGQIKQGPLWTRWRPVDGDENVQWPIDLSGEDAAVEQMMNVPGGDDDGTRRRQVVTAENGQIDVPPHLTRAERRNDSAPNADGQRLGAGCHNVSVAAT